MSPSSRKRPPSFECPHCGAAVPRGARSCRECGSDAESGWAEDAELYTTDVSGGYGGEDDFEYEEFLEREFPTRGGRLSRPALRVWAVRVVVGLVIVGLIVMLAL